MFLPILFRFLKAAVEARYRVRTMIRGEGWQYRLGSSLHNITETENAGVRSSQNVKFTFNTFLLENSSWNVYRGCNRSGRTLSSKKDFAQKKESQ